MTGLQSSIKHLHVSKLAAIFWEHNIIRALCTITTATGVAETELEQLRHELHAAHGQAQYLNQQWADIHADLLEERDRHEVQPFTCINPSPEPCKQSPVWNLSM